MTQVMDNEVGNDGDNLGEAGRIASITMSVRTAPVGSNKPASEFEYGSK